MAAGANAENSLRDDLAAGLQQIEEREAAAQPPEEQASAPEAHAEAEASETQTDRGDGRDAHGRFISKKGEGEAAASEPASDPKSAEAQATVSGQETGHPETPEAAASEGDQPPKSWRADEAQAWKDTPPAARAAILRREAEAAKLAGANDSERMFGREMADMFRPHVEEIQRAGATPQLALRTLLDNHNALRSNDPQVKYAKAAQLLHEYGIDPAQLAQVQLPDQHITALNQKIAQLEQRLSQPQGQQFAPLPPAQEDVNIATEIERFRADPAHPHFDQVRHTMGQLMEAGAASDLETAYNMAVASVPALRSTPAPAAAANLQKDATAARRASASVSGSPGPAGNPRPTDLRSELEENARKLGFL